MSLTLVCTNLKAFGPSSGKLNGNHSKPLP